MKDKAGIVYATYSPPSLEDRVQKLEREMIALVEPRADADIIRIREFQQRLLVGDGPLARIERLAEHMQAAHFNECGCRNSDDCVRRTCDAIMKICEGQL